MSDFDKNDKINEIIEIWREFFILLNSSRSKHRIDLKYLMERCNDLHFYIKYPILDLMDDDCFERVKSCIFELKFKLYNVKGMGFITSSIKGESGYKIILSDEDERFIKLRFRYLKIIFSKINMSHIYAEIYRDADSILMDAKKDVDKRANEFLGEKIPGFLSSAFSLEAKKLFNIVRNREAAFYLVLVSMIIFMVYTANEIFNMLKKSDGGWSNLPIELIFIKFSLIIPFVWVLWFLSKRLREDKRLAHEYRHKEIIARSYLTYARQLDDFNYYFYNDQSKKAKDEMALELLKVSILNLNYNPALSLGSSRSDDTPYDKLLESILSLKNKENKTD